MKSESYTSEHINTVCNNWQTLSNQSWRTWSIASGYSIACSGQRQVIFALKDMALKKVAYIERQNYQVKMDFSCAVTGNWSSRGKVWIGLGIDRDDTHLHIYGIRSEHKDNSNNIYMRCGQFLLTTNANPFTENVANLDTETYAAGGAGTSWLLNVSLSLMQSPSNVQECRFSIKTNTTLRCDNLSDYTPPLNGFFGISPAQNYAGFYPVVVAEQTVANEDMQVYFKKVSVS